MKRNKKTDRWIGRMMAALLAAVLLVGVLPVGAMNSTQVTEGSCGASTSWHFDAETGTLTISGAGAVPGYSSGSSFPWYRLRSGIQTLVVEEGVTDLGSNLVQNCEALSAVALPLSLKSIGDFAFRGCSSLTSIRIPGGVTRLGTAVFAFCTGLEQVKVDSDNAVYTAVGSAIYTKNFSELCSVSGSAPEFTVSNRTERIGEYACLGCSQLTSVTIPDSVKEIQPWAFSMTGLKTVQLPPQVTVVADSLFSGCENLTAVSLRGAVTEVGEYAFSGTAVTAFFYGGSEVEWNALLQSRGEYDNNTCMETATVHYIGREQSTVTFDVGDHGTDGHTERILRGTAIAPPETPTAPAYLFGGWYRDKGCTEPWYFGDPVTDDLTLYAAWNFSPVDDCTVTFDANAGAAAVTNLPEPQTVVLGEAATEPAAPVREAYSFKGWYTDQSGTAPWSFSSAVTGNLVLYAKWTQNGAPGEGLAQSDFVDVGDHWAKDAIAYCVERNYMNGISDTNFAPNDTVTRAMAVTVLWRIDGGTVTAGAMFPDVKENSWYTDAVAWAVKHQIVNGFDDGTFHPDEALTREQFAAILFRYASYKGENTDTTTVLSSFSDRGNVAAYAESALCWAVGCGLVRGRAVDTLVPKGTTTRAEMATIFQRYLETVLIQ